MATDWPKWLAMFYVLSMFATCIYFPGVLRRHWRQYTIFSRSRQPTSLSTHGETAGCCGAEQLKILIICSKSASACHHANSSTSLRWRKRLWLWRKRFYWSALVHLSGRSSLDTVSLWTDAFRKRVYYYTACSVGRRTSPAYIHSICMNHHCQPLSMICVTWGDHPPKSGSIQRLMRRT